MPGVKLANSFKKDAGIVIAPEAGQQRKGNKGGLLLNKCSCSMYRKPTQFEESGMPNKTGASKRELIDTSTDKRYVRRDAEGKFKESDDQGCSLAQDVKQEASTKVKSGQGDRGDQKRK